MRRSEKFVLLGTFLIIIFAVSPFAIVPLLRIWHRHCLTIQVGNYNRYIDATETFSVEIPVGVNLLKKEIQKKPILGSELSVSYLLTSGFFIKGEENQIELSAVCAISNLAETFERLENEKKIKMIIDTFMNQQLRVQSYEQYSRKTGLVYRVRFENISREAPIQAISEIYLQKKYILMLTAIGYPNVPTNNSIIKHFFESLEWYK
jgi:hypothetical protein